MMGQSIRGKLSFDCEEIIITTADGHSCDFQKFIQGFEGESVKISIETIEENKDDK